MVSTTMSAAQLLQMTEPSDGNDVTKEWLDRELETAQEMMEQRVQKLETNSDDDNDNVNDYGTEDHKGTPMDQLHELNDTVQSLALSHNVTQWASNNNTNSNNSKHTATDEDSSIFQDAHACIALAGILCRHQGAVNQKQQQQQSSLYQKIVTKEYEPLHTFVRHNLILQLRSLLRQADVNYPSPEGCGKLLALMQDAAVVSISPLTQCCDCLTKLQAWHQKVVVMGPGGAGTGTGSGGTIYCDVMTAFLRPIVERVVFHFLEFDRDRATSTKIERLPEWLLAYIREHVFLEGTTATTTEAGNGASTATSTSSPWELISTGLAPYVTEEMPMLFANEVVGLIKHVLTQRNFFRDHTIAGPESNPMLLCNAIEQLLAFDDTIRNLMPMGQADRVVRLMDIFVAGDEELLAWWLAREKEMVFSTLFDDNNNHNNNNNNNNTQIIKQQQSTKLAALVKTRISPRAELFCALIRSVQTKASVFSFSGPYLNAVAVPLCMQFLDAVHESATELRRNLADAASTSASTTTNATVLTSNIQDWIAVFNGTKLAAAILMAPSTTSNSTSSSVNDLARFGRSLEQLQNVLVEEFATTFVETFLMERVKLASYLMRCSHFLASAHSMMDNDGDGDNDDNNTDDISTHLKPCWEAFSKFLQICDDCDREGMMQNENDESSISFDTQFAPRVMRGKVVPLLADKFFEVAVNGQGLTPEVIPEGAAMFARDADALFGSFSSQQQLQTGFPIVERLLDVTRLMSLPTKSLLTLRSALMGLVGGPEDPNRPWMLHNYQFTADATLFEEAVSMLRAKGFSCELEDALSVLNRRRDLMTVV